MILEVEIEVVRAEYAELVAVDVEDERVELHLRVLDNHAGVEMVDDVAVFMLEEHPLADLAVGGGIEKHERVARYVDGGGQRRYSDVHHGVDIGGSGHLGIDDTLDIAQQRHDSVELGNKLHEPRQAEVAHLHTEGEAQRIGVETLI